MRVTVDTLEMRKLLGRLNSLLDGKSELESFRTLRIDVVNGKLRFSSTTPSIYASDTYEKDEKKRSQIEPFGVNGKEFYEAIKVMGNSGGECTIVIDKAFVAIEKGRSKLKLSKYAEDTLLPVKGEWPEGPDEGFQTLNVSEFCKAIKKILFVPENKPEKDLHSATIQINESHLVTTNRKVLAVLTNKLISCPGPTPFHMTGASAEKLTKALSSIEGDCEYLIKDHFLYISSGSFRARLSGSVMAYPPYKTIIMGHVNNFAFFVSRAELLTALKTASIATFRAEETKAVKLSFEKDGLHVDCEMSHSSSSAVVATTTTTTVPQKVIYEKMSTMNPFRFDIDLLLEGIESFSSDTIAISIHSNQRPMLFSEDDYDFYIGMLRC